MEDRKQWLEWRRKGIGSSDAPIIMGVSPWKTPLQLWEEKVSDGPIKEEASFITDKGNYWEPKIRSLYELMTGKTFSVRLVVMEDYSFIRASLDGALEDLSEIIEIKMSGKEDFEGALKGVVPEKYMPQIQHQLMVTGAKVCYFLSYLYTKGEKEINPANIAVVEVYPDQAYITNLLSEEIKFWQNNVEKKVPPTPSDRDFKFLKGHAPLFAKWKKLKDKAILIDHELKEVEDQIKKIADESNHARVRCGGVKMTLVAKQGNINYKSIPAIKSMKPEELEAYRGKGSRYWKMSLDKEEE